MADHPLDCGMSPPVGMASSGRSRHCFACSEGPCDPRREAAPQALLQSESCSAGVGVGYFGPVLLQLSGDIRRESVRRSTPPAVLGVLRIALSTATRAASSTPGGLNCGLTTTMGFVGSGGLSLTLSDACL